MESETVAKHCNHRTCAYRGKIGSTPCCDYILIAKHTRNCSISKCDKYKSGRKRAKIKDYVMGFADEIEDI